MTRPTVNPRRVARSLVSLLAAAGVVWGSLQPQHQAEVVAATTSREAPAAARDTLRVGMWTLWHDREATISPAGPDHKFTLRTCADCAALALNGSASVRAEGDALTLTASDKKLNAARIWFTAPVTLTAHGETVTLHDPVAIAARAGVLVIVVTLPVESYVERVVASESGAADSAESLKALAIVVRSFALHETHGHADYDLCDSTHCQLLHWGSNGDARRSSSCGNARNWRRDAVVSRAARAGLLRKGLRRAHRLAGRDLAARQAGFVSAVAARSVLHARRRQRVGVGDHSR